MKLIYVKFVTKEFIDMSNASKPISKKRLAAYLSSAAAIALVLCQIIGDLNV